MPGNISGGVESWATLAVALYGADAWGSTDIDTLLLSGDFASGINFGIDVGSGTFSCDNSIADPATGNPLGLVVLGSGTLDLTGNR